MAGQTVSTQVRELERSLGYALLKPAGRGIALTDAGVAVMQQVEKIFQPGEQLPAALIKIFGAAVFPVAELVEPELMARYGVRRVDACEGVDEHFFAIGVQKKLLPAPGPGAT
jgi:DNA-binding transcriptional LysR family regulator